MIKIDSIIILCLLSATSFVQVKKSSDPPINWPVLDLQQDGYQGMSAENPIKNFSKIKNLLRRSL